MDRRVTKEKITGEIIEDLDLIAIRGATDGWLCRPLPPMVRTSHFCIPAPYDTVTKMEYEFRGQLNKWFYKVGYTRGEIDAMQAAIARVKEVPDVYIRPTQTMPLSRQERLQISNLMREEDWLGHKE